MVLLLRSAIRNAWPPKTDTQVKQDGSLNAREVVLQEGIYWDFVRPFTPVNDRVVVSKRCSTRFYAGNRVELNESYLKKFERRVKVKDADGRWVDGETVLCYTLPVARGEPGTNNFCLEFREEVQHVTNNVGLLQTDVALEKVRAARKAWDEHLSRIPTPATRLDACLNILATSGINGSCSFLFDGKGDVGDVIKFHASMDIMALNGSFFHPAYRGDLFSFSLGRSNEVLPNTQLGGWVTRYMNRVQQELENPFLPSFTWRFESIVEELLDAGADVGPFFEPLEYPLAKASILTPLSAISRGLIPTLYSKGMCLCEMMRHYLILSHRLDNDNDCTRELGNLLDILSRKSAIELRFHVGDWVECNMEEGWTTGVVTKQWSRGYSYEVILVESGTAASPFDTDEYVRRPELRFRVGDRVECCMEEGWMPGTVKKHWSDLNRCPYEVALDSYKKWEFCTAPCDMDDYIRALNE
mmetsp:Transcript_1012/g.2118  ORF Transcript_1012/g.2118 Transcript_1012/m.2118 type:complete len:470 (-) Transcript_1012:589-1998(-)